MAFISQQKFSKLAGVSDETLRKDIITKKVVIDKKLAANNKPCIDPKNPKNIAYVEEIQKKKAKQVSKKIVQDMDEAASLDEKKIKAEIKYKEEQTLNIKQKRLQSLDLLITKELVERRFAKLGVSIKTHINIIPRRTVAHIFAMAKSGKSIQEAEAFLTEELEKALKSAKLGSGK